MIKPACIILAGGRATRMGGGDKTLLSLGGRPLLSHIIEALRPQVGALAINATGDAARFAAWSLPVVGDPFPGEGPLSGILAGLRWARGPAISTPADTPFLPPNLVEKLMFVSEREHPDVVMAAWRGAVQPAIALWSPQVMQDLEYTLAQTRMRGVESFARTRKWAVANFDDGPDPFFNINTPSDLAAAEARLTSA
ncbi:MAG: molybdenum cofactor guanylyltransferase MobA [Rhodospirillaceae bacterium]|nr:molybdenum cofactor guanylyltransferase MobA [Rhodospirillaceae bacterium]